MIVSSEYKIKVKDYLIFRLILVIFCISFSWSLMKQPSKYFKRMTEDVVFTMRQQSNGTGLPRMSFLAVMLHIFLLLQI